MCAYTSPGGEGASCRFTSSFLRAQYEPKTRGEAMNSLITQVLAAILILLSLVKTTMLLANPHAGLALSSGFMQIPR